MKKLFMISTAVLISAIVSCTITQQRKMVNTIGTVELTATSAVDSYYTLVINGNLPTNDVPKISQAYDDLQGTIKIALDAVQYNTNALAPGNLIIESQDLVNLVSQIKGASK